METGVAWDDESKNKIPGAGGKVFCDVGGKETLLSCDSSIRRFDASASAPLMLNK